MSTEFAKYLAQLRRDSGISQREAAAALQVSQALLSHYEKGIREPGLDFVVRAADYYQVSADHLLGRIPPQSMSPTIPRKRLSTSTLRVQNRPSGTPWM